MVIVNILDKRYWDVWIAGSHYNTKPKIMRTVKDWCIAEKADVAYNLALFNFSDGKTVTFVHNPVGDIGYGGKGEIVHLNQQNYCRGYSSGITNNKVVINAPLGGSRTRNGVGLTSDNNVIIAQSNTKMTEKSFCNKVLQIAGKQGAFIKLFVLEDGGGSTAHYSAVSRLGFAPEGVRKVPTVLCLRRKNPPKVTRTLQRGCKGDDVKLLQQVLGGIEVDGSFGIGINGTRQRVIAAQKALGLKQDGIAGPATLKALGLQ